MKFLLKYKDKISTYAGLIAALTAGILFVAAQYNVTLPSLLSTILAIISGSSIGLIGFLVGKYPNIPAPQNNNEERNGE